MFLVCASLAVAIACGLAAMLVAAPLVGLSWQVFMAVTGVVTFVLTIAALD
jgi:hypothetical protein